MTQCFELGETVVFGARQLRVLARVVYGNVDALWDEWYVELEDGSGAWLEIEDGQRFLSRKQPLPGNVPPFEEIAVGQYLILDERPFFVAEKCRAEIMQIEGEAPPDVLVGDAVNFVDGSVLGQPASLEFCEGTVEFALGESL